MIIMLQVGSDGSGQALSNSLQNLTPLGGKFEIGHSVPFPRLKEIVLTRALVEGIINDQRERIARNREGKSTSNLSADTAIRKMRRDQAQVEKKLLEK